MSNLRILASGPESEWQPLHKIKTINLTKSQIQAFAKAKGVSYKTFKDHVAQDKKEQWMNDKYLVAIRRDEMEGMGVIVHLSIKTHDNSHVTDWRDKQKIKNQLVGPECEGVELYPAESRLMDTANQFHIWCFADTKFRQPFGLGLRSTSEFEGEGVKQRKFGEDE